MHLVEEHYSTIDVAFSKALGIWPHDRSRFVILKNVLMIILTIPHLCLQFSVFITTEYTMTLFIKVMSFACPCMITTLMYVVFLFKSKTVTNLHNQIEKDWMLLNDKLEIDIIQKNAHDNQVYILILFLYSVLIIVITTVMQFSPVMLDIVFPLDKPRSWKLFIMVEYFVFHNKYFYTKMLHELVFVTACATMIFVTATQLLVFAVHAQGMFKIARHRIEYSVQECVWLHVSSPEKEHAIRNRIMHAVIAHRRAMEFSRTMVSSFDGLYCSLIVLIVISLSINLYGIIETTIISKNLEIVLLCCTNILGLLGYMLLAFYFDQKLSDKHDEIFHVIYATSWYSMPVSSQKLILFLLQITGKDFYIKIGFVFVSKIENFATLINTSLSYVTMMYSVSQI